MKENIIKKIISITIGATVVLFVLIVAIIEAPIFSLQSFKLISPIVMGLTFFWIFYFNYGWRWIIIKNIIYKPNLNGTWIGCFQSDYKNEKGEGVPVSDMVLVIRQNFLQIHITTFTEKYTSYSYGESFFYNDDTRKRRLLYLYARNLMQSDQEDDRQGASELQVFGRPENELVGHYWTIKKTNGFIKVRLKTREHYETFEQAKSIWKKEADWKLIQDK